MTAATWAAVAVGGAIGASLRHLVTIWLASAVTRGEFPWSTLAVNFAGTALLAFLTGLALNGRGLADEWHVFWGPGFCGALTTFSTVAVELVVLVRVGSTAQAVTYGAVSLVGAIAIIIAIFAALRVRF